MQKIVYKKVSMHERYLVSNFYIFTLNLSYIIALCRCIKKYFTYKPQQISRVNIEPVPSSLLKRRKYRRARTYF